MQTACRESERKKREIHSRRDSYSFFFFFLYTSPHGRRGNLTNVGWDWVDFFLFLVVCVRSYMCVCVRVVCSAAKVGRKVGFPNSSGPCGSVPLFFLQNDVIISFFF